MTIDKNKLIDLLVEKTNMERDEIRDQLDRLIERILDAAKRGKALEIKEFGLFYFDEEGELSFDPSDELSTEISFKYAGMKPVELKPERDTSITDAEDDELFEDWDDEVEEEPDSTAASEPVEDDDSVDDSLYDPFVPETTEPPEEPVKEEPKTSIDEIKPVVSRHNVRKRKDNTGVFIIIGIIVVAVLVGLYFYYIGLPTQNTDGGGDEPTSQTSTGPDVEQEDAAMSDDLLMTDAESVNGQNEQDNEQTTEESQPVAEQETDDQVSDEESPADIDVSVPETEQSIYGLRGQIVEQANNGYSIVLHSFSSEDRAIETANRLEAEGYRVIITPRTVYEKMVWRVSVGQFETLANAQQATTQLPSPYNTQNFIQRIQTN